MFAFPASHSLDRGPRCCIILCNFLFCPPFTTESYISTDLFNFEIREIWGWLHIFPWLAHNWKMLLYSFYLPIIHPFTTESYILTDSFTFEIRKNRGLVTYLAFRIHGAEVMMIQFYDKKKGLRWIMLLLELAYLVLIGVTVWIREIVTRGDCSLQFFVQIGHWDLYDVTLLRHYKLRLTSTS